MGYFLSKKIYPQVKCEEAKMNIPLKRIEFTVFYVIIRNIVSAYAWLFLLA